MINGVERKLETSIGKFRYFRDISDLERNSKDEPMDRRRGLRLSILVGFLAFWHGF